MSAFKDPSKFLRLVTVLGIKNLKLKYKNSIFGFLWGMFNPVIYLVIFSFVFGNMFSEIDRYPLYVLSGLLLWTLFTTTSVQIIESITRNTGVIKSVSIPNIALPLGGMYSSIVSFLLMLIPFSIMMAIFGMRLGWEVLLFIPLLLLFSLFTFGLSLILTAFNVYFRDVQIAWSSFMPAIFYATPIAYTPEIIPAKFQLIIQLNPIHHYVSFLRDLIYYNRMPDAMSWMIVIVISALSMWFGLTIFNKLKGGFISQF